MSDGNWRDEFSDTTRAEEDDVSLVLGEGK
jgi:hypothetical protein